MLLVRPLRLCIVNPFQHGGGAEYQISCLIEVLSSTGRFDISYLAHHTEPRIQPEHYNLVKIGRDERIPRFGYSVDMFELYGALIKIKPDVIYQRVACAYTGICAHYARRHNVRMVWHVAHESDVMRDSAVYGRNPVRRFLEKSSVEYGIRHASHIVTQTHDQAALLLANYGRRAVAVIPNFHPEPMEAIDKSDTPIVAWVANLKPWKRPDAFVRLANALEDLSNVRFVMVGADHGGSGNVEWHTDLMRSMKKAPNLEYVGQLQQSEVNTLLAHARIFVNTSTQEGFPNTFIQAWMRGTPVVSLSVDPDNILEKERVGIYAGSEPRMEEAIRTLIGDREIYEGYASRARLYALSRHSMRNAVELAELLGASQKQNGLSSDGTDAVQSAIKE